MSVNMHIHKILSAAFLGLLFGLYIHHDHVRWGHLGREAFLVHESRRFDLFMAGPHPAPGSILGGIIVVLALIGVYELISFGLSKILKSAPLDGGGTKSYPPQ
jgi:hypothetical protein